MTVAELIAEAQSRDIRLWADGDRLRYSSPKGALDESLTALLKARKSEILAFLRDEPGRSNGAPIPRAPRGGRIPLSPAQQRLWLLDRLEPLSAAYNVPAALRLRGRLSVKALRRSIQAIVERHEVLRTRFRSEGDQVWQEIDPPAAWELIAEEVSGSEALRERIASECARPYELERGSLLRVHLFRTAPDDHVLLVAMHHIVSDGWSIGVLVSELSQLYRALVEGRPSPLPELSIQYADYACWQREALHPGKVANALSYWRTALDGIPALELPADRPRPAVKTYDGSQVHFTIGADLANDLRELVRSRHATLFMSLLAAFEVLLSRYSGQSRFAVGTPTANRGRQELEPLVGFFVNALALSCNLSGDPSFFEVLDRVRETCVEAYSHQDLPFEKLVEELQLPRDPSRTPVFQVMFALQNAPEGRLELPGLILESLPLESRFAKFDLALAINEAEGGALHGILEYNASLFDCATMERLASNFVALLQDAASRPNSPSSELALLDPGELRRVLYDFSRAPAEPVDERPIHLQMAERALQSPDSPALIADSETLTYQALNARADSLAAELRASGVGLESTVAICLDRSIDLVVAQLAALKAGAAYVPLDPAYPAERIGFMLQDCRASAVITLPGFRHLLGDFQGQIVEPQSANEPRPSLPSAHVEPDNLAYVIYTSGSTGRPKGVAVTHRSLANLCAWHRRAFHVSTTSTATLLAGVGFDASVWETWPYLTSGGCIRIVDREVLLDPARLVGLLESDSITHSFLPTPVAEGLLNTSWPTSISLEVLLTGGDRLSRCPRAALPFRIVNNYGPTEATVVSTSIDLEASDSTVAPSIGRPISNTAAYVLDSALNPVPVGVPGELFVAGASLARGYFGDAAQTATRFLPDPFSGTLGARMYRTGDMARWRADGSLEFLGRGDSQIKIRGFRIEPGDTESALLALPDVRQAAVVARESGGEARLIAYLVPHGGPRPTIETLRGQLRKRLPAYMVPSAFVWMDQLPLTPNGKIDRAALLTPSLDESRTAVGKAARTPMEEMLAGIFAELLGVTPVSRDDDFFVLGGHSLLATQAASRIRAAAGVDLPLRVLFEDSTVARLAARVQEFANAARPSGDSELKPVPRDRPLELSFAQQRLWFLDQIEPNSSLYSMPILLRLSGTLDVEALRYAIERLVGRHEVLRTTFTARDGTARQEVQPPSHWNLLVSDLTHFEPESRLGDALRLALQQTGEPFDLTIGPLLRTTLFKLDQTDHLLLINTHHIASDGWSVGVMVREVAELYAAYLEQRRPELPDLPIQYADFAHWQRRYLRGEVLDEALAYWRQRLEGAAVLRLPPDFPRPPEQSYRGAVHVSDVSKVLVEQLRALGRREDVTLFMLLTAAFQLLLSKYSGQTDVSIGSAIANRNRPEIEPLVGFFVNLLVLRTDLSGNPRFVDLLKRVRETALGAYAHQDLPFEALVEALGVVRDPGRTPLFQVAFTLQNAPLEELRLPGVIVTSQNADTGTAKFDLSVEVTETATGLTVRWEYNTGLFRAATIERMAHCFRTVLEFVASAPETPLADIRVLDPAEETRVLLASHGFEVGEPEIVAVHRQFEAHAVRTPAATALRWKGQSVSYAELDGNANRLAHHLRELGAAPEQRVALCLGRSPELITAILGVLKTGAAYLPLDPEQPAARLGYMLDEARVCALVTDSRIAGIFSSSNTPIVRIDEDASAIAQRTTERPEVDVWPDSPAYLIFTSGSTGQPKAVEVSHGALANLCGWHTRAFQVTAESRGTHLAGLAFDASVWELWPYLVAGGSVTLVPSDILAMPQSLAACLADERITHTFLPTPIAELLLSSEWPQGMSLRTMLTGGDRLSRGPSVSLPFRFFNNYGPTEAAVVSTSGIVLPDTGDAPSIGRAIDGFRTYVLDPAWRVVPFGVPGELFVAGRGLARGYFGKPGLTADRFLPDPYSTEPGERMYRTGDLAILRENGEVDFLGRLDQQVKIRGHRIEPGEIEVALATHPAVAQVAVLAREDRGNKRLIGYVAAHPHAFEEETTALLDEHVEDWRALYDDTYAPATEDGAFNPIGWNSSYSGEAIPSEEMRLWRDHTVQRIRAIHPSSILEIGCGTGLLLFQLAGECSRYVATDFSAAALNAIRPELQRRNWTHVEVLQRLATDLSGIPPGSIDVVVLNSVSQYFPDLAYLNTVISEAVKLVRDGGALFIGDVRSFPLLEAFQTSIALYQERGDLPTGELREKVRRAVQNERELLVDPEYFRHLAGINSRVAHAEVWLKQGGGRDEMNRYRYDAIVRVGLVAEPVAIGTRIAWAGVEGLERQLAGNSMAVEVHNIPNARVFADVAASRNSDESLSTARDLAEWAVLQADQAGAVEPDQLWQLGERLGFTVRITPADGGDIGSMVALFERDNGLRPWVIDRSGRALALPLANNPLRTRQEIRLTADLRFHLEARLPDYMVPAMFVFLDALPLTPNGKVNRSALPAPEAGRPHGETGYVAPRSANEQALAGIWRQVLGVDRVGIEDNFFSLGGDSILSIQVVTRAARAGLKITPKQIFEHQTVAALARVADIADSPGPAVDTAAGDAPLSPIQHWFFEKDFQDPQHFNQSLLLRLQPDLDRQILDTALRALQTHHHALRMRFRCLAGEWRQFCTHESEIEAPYWIDLSACPATELEAAVEAASSGVQASLSFEKGPVFRAAVLELGPANGTRLLMVAHHLVVDGVSWRILVEDLATAIAQLQRGEPADLGHRGTSFQHWASRLADLAAAGTFEKELPYWLGTGNASSEIPIDYPAGANTVSSARTVTRWLDPLETSLLLHKSSAAYRTEINDLLLAALARTMQRWTGQTATRVDLEGHGREELVPQCDVSRTCGWFTSIFPIVLDASNGDDTAQLIKSVKELLRTVPHRGVGLGILRYLSPAGDLRHRLQALPPNAVSFNYLGQFTNVLPSDGPFAFADEPSGAAQSPRAQRSHAITVNCLVAAGKLRVDWIYSENLHRQGTIEQLATGYLNALRQVVEHCSSPGAWGYTPSDFPLARLDQQALDRLTVNAPDIEALYPLSPLQHGLLFHSLHSGSHSMYFQQLCFELRGDADEEAIERAWRHVWKMHPALRASVVWEEKGRPLQWIRRDTKLPFERQDWLLKTAHAESLAVTDFLEQDRARGFRPEDRAWMRVALICLPEQRYRLIFSFHHILMDGWSLPIVMRDFLRSYEAAEKRRPLPALPAATYQDFIRHLDQSDSAGAESFWREYLRGHRHATPLPRPPQLPSGPEAGPQECHASMDSALTVRLRRFAQQHGFTLNTLVQAAWGLLLSRYVRSGDVVFGVAVSGRPADLKGVEEIVGLFINMLPFRVRTTPDQPLPDFLRACQDQQTELRRFESTSLAAIQRWSEMPSGEALFDCILGFENYPLDSSLRKARLPFTIDGFQFFERTHYPLAVTVSPRETLGIRITVDSARFHSSFVERMLGHFTNLLDQMSTGTAKRLGDLSLVGPSESAALLARSSGLSTSAAERQRVDIALERQSAQTPSAAAVECGSETLTYERMNQRANQLASRLRTLGVGPERRVGICLEPSIDFVVAALAVMKSGGAYVPIDPKHPAARMRLMLEDSGAVVCITTSAMQASLPAVSRMVLLDAEVEALAVELADDPQGWRDPAHAAYVIYTSGSTGRPKGVEVSHAGLANLCEWHRRAFDVTSDARATQLASLSFDASVWELWPYLACGASIAIPPADTLSTPDSLIEYLAAHRISHCFVPTPLTGLLLDRQWPADIALRFLLTGGDRLMQNPPRGLAFQVVNNYGPTEATVVSTSGALLAGASGVPSLGLPIDNVSVYLLDDRLDPVPDGIPGEMYIAGRSLARGYLNQPSLTAAHFLPNPFVEASRMYRTGDLARRLPDGSLEFLGRIDRQVKVRGFRIELGELEAALGRHPAVREAIAGIRQGLSGDPALFAWVVLRDGIHASAAELRAHLSSQLPSYMAAPVISILDQFPLTPNGKVDLTALPVPQAGNLERPVPVAARNGLEEMLADMWSELLGVPAIGIEDDFFELGGHSLLATQLVSRMKSALRTTLTLPEFFNAPTIAALSTILQSREPAPGQFERIAQAWKQIRSMSPEERERLLSQKKKQRTTV